MDATERTNFRVFIKALTDPIAPAPSRYDYGKHAACKLMMDAGMYNRFADAERAWKRIATAADYGHTIQRHLQSGLDTVRRKTGFSGPELAEAAQAASQHLGIWRRFVDEITGARLSNYR